MSIDYGSSTHTDYFIVGVGNALRSDDGAGLLLAEKLNAALRRRGAAAQLRLVQQLLPELAAEIGEVQPTTVVVADCSASAAAAAVRRLDDQSQAAWESHGLTASQLIVLANKLYGYSGIAWLVTVPGANFAHGENLSSTTQDAIENAIAMVAGQI